MKTCKRTGQRLGPLSYSSLGDERRSIWTRTINSTEEDGHAEKAKLIKLIECKAPSTVERWREHLSNQLVLEDERGTPLVENGIQNQWGILA